VVESFNSNDFADYSNFGVNPTARGGKEKKKKILCSIPALLSMNYNMLL